MVTSEFKQVIDDSRHNLAINEHGHLPLRLRKEIWMAMGDIPDPNVDVPQLTVGHRARALLAIHAVRRVLPLWNAHFSNIDEPTRLVELSTRYTNGELTLEDIRNTKNAFRAGLDNTQGLSTLELNALMVGWAAVRMATTATVGDDFIEEDLDEEDEDLDLWDASMYAAGAYAGGFPFIDSSEPHSSDPKRLREFWEWYIAEAERVFEAIAQESH